MIFLKILFLYVSDYFTTKEKEKEKNHFSLYVLSDLILTKLDLDLDPVMYYFHHRQ